MMPHATASPTATLRGSPPITANARCGLSSASGSSAACCSRRSTGARLTATAARVGSLVAPHTDPFSGQPENKATPASIAPYEYVFRGFALSRTPLELPAHAWWARVAVNGGYGYLLADNADLAGWQSWLGSIAGDDLAEYKDFGGGVYRAASFAADRIETCLFIGPARDAGDWNVVKGLFAADTLSNEQRRMLLSGKSSDGLANAGPIVCACFGVGRTTICDAIASRRAFGRRDRRETEGRHQLRLLHSGDEAADRAGRAACRAAASGGGELESASPPSLQARAKQSILSFLARWIASSLALLAMTR